MIYTAYFDDEATGAVQDGETTMLALRAADTLGNRFKILEIFVGPADDAPADLNVGLQLKRVDNVSAGSAGTPASTPTPEPSDSLARASVITAGVNYAGAEPSTYGDPLDLGDMNRRNSILKKWDEFDESIPVVNRDQLAGLVAIPRTAAAAVLSGHIKYKEF